jgi:hypothetical protein
MHPLAEISVKEQDMLYAQDAFGFLKKSNLVSELVLTTGSVVAAPIRPWRRQSAHF